MKKCMFLLLILIVVFSCAIISSAENTRALELKVSINNGANLNVTYTATLYPPFDAPKLVNFYTAPVNGNFVFVGSAWTDAPQIATYSFHQDSGSYKGKATCELPGPYGLVESNIVSYIVP